MKYGQNNRGKNNHGKNNRGENNDQLDNHGNNGAEPGAVPHREPHCGRRT
ncbi:MAG: hypothetical protein ABW215_04860 [Kibdelosporangium sp.]